ncbi:MAG: hypothetical protein V7785_08505 [Bermanella sp.]
MKLTERDIKIAIVAALLAFTVSVVLLDMKGYIKHTGSDEASVVEEFKLLAVGAEELTRVSSKSANKEAFCADGHLLIRPQKNNSGNAVAGLLVDAKNRTIPCSTELPAPGM